jgi:hypothetical protein
VKTLLTIAGERLRHSFDGVITLTAGDFTHSRPITLVGDNIDMLLETALSNALLQISNKLRAQAQETTTTDKKGNIPQ